MSGEEHLFLFELPDTKQPSSARKVHIRRLYDILQLCIHRSDIPRAKRAWTILARCKEVNWKVMWRIGVCMLGESVEEDAQQNAERLEYLATMMLQFSESRQAILQEIVLRLISTQQHRKALDELELYLPAAPYQENTALHIYAGLICIYLAQQSSESGDSNTPSNERDPPSWNPGVLRDARQYLERAIYLDPDNVVAMAWLEKLPTLTHPFQSRKSSPNSDDEQTTNDRDETGQRHKRART